MVPQRHPAFTSLSNTWTSCSCLCKWPQPQGISQSQGLNLRQGLLRPGSSRCNPSSQGWFLSSSPAWSSLLSLEPPPDTALSPACNPSSPAWSSLRNPLPPDTALSPACPPPNPNSQECNPSNLGWFPNNLLSLACLPKDPTVDREGPSFARCCRSRSVSAPAFGLASTACGTRKTSSAPPTTNTTPKACASSTG